MKIIRVKNLIGLCACEGCKKRFRNCIELKFEKKAEKQLSRHLMFVDFGFATITHGT